MTAVHGEVAAGFEPVRDAFAENFASRGEVGAALCVHRGGVPLVDLWGGSADPVERTPWQADTLALVFSTTKGITAICVHRLAERGAISTSREIDVDELPDRSARGPGKSPDASRDPQDLSALAESRMTLQELSDRYIEEVLRITGGNKVKASRILGIDRKTLYRRRLGSGKRD